MKLNDFGPFHSDVWGNVSEWIMVAVTATTLYYIVKTLNSQQEVQKMEAENQRHSQRQYLRSMLPVVSLLPGTSSASSLRQFIFVLNDNKAKNLTFWLNDNLMSFTPMPFEIPIGFHYHFRISHKNTEESDLEKGKNFALRFQDIEGNLYEQKMERLHYDWSLSFPKLINASDPWVILDKPSTERKFTFLSLTNSITNIIVSLFKK
jgi:hypothetical protein